MYIVGTVEDYNNKKTEQLQYRNKSHVTGFSLSRKIPYHTPPFLFLCREMVKCLHAGVKRGEGRSIRLLWTSRQYVGRRVIGFQTRIVPQ